MAFKYTIPTGTVHDTSDSGNTGDIVRHNLAYVCDDINTERAGFDAFRPGPMSTCDDVTIELVGFDTFKPSSISIFHGVAPEHTDCDSLRLGNTSNSVHDDVVTQNTSFDNLRFGNPASIHDVVANENTGFETSGHDVDSTTTVVGISVNNDGISNTTGNTIAKPLVSSRSIHHMLTRSKRGFF
ncbi:hypothetical protein U1Q18_045332 [Sarracenia purpurea var. burkii]